MSIKIKANELLFNRWLEYNSMLTALVKRVTMSGAQLFQNDIDVEVSDLKDWKKFVTENMSEIRDKLELVEKLYEVSIAHIKRSVKEQ